MIKMDKEKNELDVLKEIAFDILKEEKGCDFCIWQDTLLKDYTTEVMDAFGENPYDVYPALSDLWETPYFDKNSGLEYTFMEWALAFATDESVRMYYDMIYVFERKIKEASHVAPRNIE